jgi:hypothetical protein
MTVQTYSDEDWAALTEIGFTETDKNIHIYGEVNLVGGNKARIVFVDDPTKPEHEKLLYYVLESCIDGTQLVKAQETTLAEAVVALVMLYDSRKADHFNSIDDFWENS